MPRKISHFRHLLMRICRLTAAEVGDVFGGTGTREPVPTGSEERLKCAGWPSVKGVEYVWRQRAEMQTLGTGVPEKEGAGVRGSLRHPAQECNSIKWRVLFPLRGCVGGGPLTTSTVVFMGLFLLCLFYHPFPFAPSPFHFNSWFFLRRRSPRPRSQLWTDWETACLDIRSPKWSAKRGWTTLIEVSALRQCN